MNYQSGLNFSKFLSGVSKTLGVANQVIPIYQQTKPLFSNVRKAYDLIKVNNTLPRNSNLKKEENLNLIPEAKRTIIKKDNSPQFFI